jgi:hypothetical protein
MTTEAISEDRARRSAVATWNRRGPRLWGQSRGEDKGNIRVGASGVGENGRKPVKQRGWFDQNIKPEQSGLPISNDYYGYRSEVAMPGHDVFPDSGV